MRRIAKVGWKRRADSSHRFELLKAPATRTVKVVLNGNLNYSFRDFKQKIVDEYLNDDVNKSQNSTFIESEIEIGTYQDEVITGFFNKKKRTNEMLGIRQRFSTR